MPVPTGSPSMTVTGMIPPAVEVTSTSAAPAQVVRAQPPLLQQLAGLAGELDHEERPHDLRRLTERRVMPSSVPLPVVSHRPST